MNGADGAERAMTPMESLTAAVASLARTLKVRDGARSEVENAQDHIESLRSQLTEAEGDAKALEATLETHGGAVDEAKRVIVTAVNEIR